MLSSLTELEKKLKAAKQKLGRMQRRSQKLKNTFWRREAATTIQKIQARLQKLP